MKAVWMLVFWKAASTILTTKKLPIACATAAKYWLLWVIAPCLAVFLPCAISSQSKNRFRRAYIETESTDESGKIPRRSRTGVPTKVRAFRKWFRWIFSCRVARPARMRFSMFLAELAQGRIPEVKGDKLHWH